MITPMKRFPDVVRVAHRPIGGKQPELGPATLRSLGMPKLKVFCTTSGFYDHVVAAPSKPAALKAWGAKTDLFSMGVARLVTDPKIEKQALERPGEIIRLKRDGGKEPKAALKRKSKSAAERPNRTKLKAAETALSRLEEKQATELDALEHEIRALESKRKQLRKRHSKALRAAEDKLQEAKDAYQASLDDWDED